MRLLLILALFVVVESFATPSDNKRSSSVRLSAWNPLAEVGDFFRNLDDIAEDFLFKRMGNGEVFYGKRKYKPSTRAEENDWEYNGLGLSDHSRIEAARERKAEFLAERERQRAQAEE